MVAKVLISNTYPLIRGYYNLQMKRYFWGIRIFSLFEFQNVKYFGPFQSFIKYLVTWKVIWRAAKGRLNQHLYLPIGQLLMVVVFRWRSANVRPLCQSTEEPMNGTKLEVIYKITKTQKRKSRDHSWLSTNYLIEKKLERMKQNRENEDSDSNCSTESPRNEILTRTP